MEHFDSLHDPDIKLRGLPASRGIAIGSVLRLDERGRHQFYYIEVPASGVRPEVKRLRRSFTEAREQLKDLRNRLVRELGSENAYILDAHLLMLEDKKLQAKLESEIRGRRISAEWAVRDVCSRIANSYRLVKDAYLRERASDIEDVATRVLTILSGDTSFNLSKLDHEVIIVAEDIWPSTVAELDLKRVLAFATDAGGLTSHSAIIARALGLPAVVGLHNITRHARTGDMMIVDGAAGQIIVRPSRTHVREFRRKREEEAESRARLMVRADEPAMTMDGHRIKLRANVELAPEVESLTLFGAEGIGLYRSEYLFLNKLPDLPTEDEQYRVYRALAEASGSEGASIRIFDMGGDKLSLEGFEPEENPALGLRAIRLAFRVEEIFRAQIRAILRANMKGNLRIVLPLVSTVDELERAKRILAEVKSSMAEASIDHNANLPVGAMIEVPAAALTADHFVRHADFLSVGTNDLIQYLLAVDRTNENVAHLYQPLHPAVLRTIAHLVKAASAAGIPLEVCGEMAANPLQAVALVGLGVRVLSVAPSAIPLIKNTIRSIDISKISEVVGQALKNGSSSAVEDMLRRHIPSPSQMASASLAPTA